MTRALAPMMAALVAAVAATLGLRRQAPTGAVAAVKATRLASNPLLTVESSPSLGNNINGPSVIRVPTWVRQPLGRYYMYFAHHKGEFIRLAYADEIGGPWKVYEPGVIHVRTTAFFRPQPDPPENPAGFYTHVASPEVYVDQDRRRIVMWFHGWWTAGQRWPSGEAAAREWATAHRYGQATQAALSSDGIHFEPEPAITRESYIRVFRHQGLVYGMGRLGRLVRARDYLDQLEPGPNPFREGPYENRARHVAVVRRDGRLGAFFSGIGDAPERILMSWIDLTGDWATWMASAPIEVLQPETAYECADLPNLPSVAGDAAGPVRQLRDPAVFEENGKTYLFYSVCGEQGIAAAELTFSEGPR